MQLKRKQNPERQCRGDERKEQKQTHLGDLRDDIVVLIDQLGRQGVNVGPTVDRHVRSHNLDQLARHVSLDGGPIQTFLQGS